MNVAELVKMFYDFIISDEELAETVLCDEHELVRRHRDNIEFHLPQPTQALKVARHFADEGWCVSRVNDAQRLLVGFKVDWRGDGFEDVRVFVSLDALKHFFMRYEGDVLRPQKVLIDAVNDAVRLPRDSEDVFTGFHGLVCAEQAYVSGRVL